VKTRREERRRTRFRQGRLFNAYGGFLSRCSIIDRSENGARVRAAEPLALLTVDRSGCDARGFCGGGGAYSRPRCLRYSMPTSAIHAEARLGGVSPPGGDGQGPIPECSLCESLANRSNRKNLFWAYSTIC